MIKCDSCNVELIKDLYKYPPRYRPTDSLAPVNTEYFLCDECATKEYIKGWAAPTRVNDDL